MLPNFIKKSASLSSSAVNRKLDEMLELQQLKENQRSELFQATKVIRQEELSTELVLAQDSAIKAIESLTTLNTRIATNKAAIEEALK